MIERLATEICSTRRSLTVSGKRGQPQPFLHDLACTPLAPADSGRAGQLLQRLKLETTHQLLDTVIVGTHDVAPGDVLVVAGQEYVIRAAGRWATRRVEFMHVTVEDVV